MSYFMLNFKKNLQYLVLQSTGIMLPGVVVRKPLSPPLWRPCNAMTCIQGQSHEKVMMPKVILFFSHFSFRHEIYSGNVIVRVSMTH